MTPEQLEEVYTKRCYRLTGIGEDRLADGLARVVLVLLNEFDDAERVHSLIADALSDLSAAGQEDGPWRPATHQ